MPLVGPNACLAASPSFEGPKGLSSHRIRLRIRGADMKEGYTSAIGCTSPKWIVLLLPGDPEPIRPYKLSFCELHSFMFAATQPKHCIRGKT